MEYSGLTYLDNAATSFPKPPEVYGEVMRSLMLYGGNAGRGAHRLSLAAADKIYECRALAAEMLGVADVERIFFTLNATYGLNTVIKGLLKKGDHVLISDMEHNAVYRPVYRLAKEGRVAYSTYKSYAADKDRTDEKICGGILGGLRRNTKMVICNHHSNICSAKMPIKKIGELCKRAGVLFTVDGSQSAGHEKIAVDEMGIDALCVPSHKGFYGPQGCGIVALGKGVLPLSLAEGGNGVNSLEGEMPQFSPERYEAGTLPTPAIAGLYQGMKFVKDVGIEEISDLENKLFLQARERLSEIKGVEIYLPEMTGAILSFNIEGISADKVGALLDKRGVCVRSGYHCSALGHKTLKTYDRGTVRVSFGAFNDETDVDELWRGVKAIASKSEY